MKNLLSGAYSDNEVLEILEIFKIHLPTDIRTIAWEFRNRGHQVPRVVSEYYTEFVNFPHNAYYRIFRGRPRYSYEDLEAIAPLWNSQYEEAVSSTITKDGWFWFLVYERTVASLVEQQILQMGKTYLDFVSPKEAKKIQKNPRMWDVKRGVTHYLIDYACCWASRQPHIKEIMRSWLRAHAGPLKCQLCGNNYSLLDTREPFYRSFKGQIEFCDHCLVTALYGSGVGYYSHSLTEKSREPMLADLRELVAVGQMVPSSKFLYDYTGRSAYLLRLLQDGRPGLMRILQRIRPVRDYKEVFGSWLKALIAAGLLEDDSFETPRGIRCVAVDGHECHSLAEKMIDDWLLQNQIPHTREPHYPRHSKYNPNGKLRADWLVEDTYIEYLGLAGELAYDGKTKNKVNLAREIGLGLICINPEDLENLRHQLERLMG